MATTTEADRKRADAFRNSGKEAAEKGLDWALAGLVAEQATKQLGTKRDSGAAFNEGVGIVLDTLRFDIADRMDAVDLARHANALYQVNDSSRAGSWSFGNFMKADQQYMQLAEADRIADAQDAADTAAEQMVAAREATQQAIAKARRPSPSETDANDMAPHTAIAVARAGSMPGNNKSAISKLITDQPLMPSSAAAPEVASTVKPPAAKQQQRPATRRTTSMMPE